MSTTSETAAVALGAVQGLTEFLPISSDGHLALARAALGVRGGALSDTLLLHLGTLVATFAILRADVVRLVREPIAALRTGRSDDPSLREAASVVVASVPTAAIGLGLHDVVAATSDDLAVVAGCLAVSGLFVLSTARTGHGEAQVLSLRASLLLGVVQGLAVLPGWSRSGSTIATAMALGLAPTAAFRLSFLLSLPAVAGACLLELRHPETLAALGPTDALGALVALVVGAAALHALRGVVARGRFAWFAAYLFPLAIAVAAFAARAP